MVNMKAAFNFVGEGVANIAARQIQHAAPNIAHNVPYAPLANAADNFAYAAAQQMGPVLSAPNMMQAKQAFLNSLNGKANEGIQAVYAQLAEQAMANPEVRNYFTALAQQSGFQGELAEQFAKHMIGQQQFALTHGAQAAAHAPNVTPFAQGYNSTMAHAHGGPQGIDIAGQFQGRISPEQLAAANGNPYAAVDAAARQQLAGHGGGLTQQELAMQALANTAGNGGHQINPYSQEAKDLIKQAKKYGKLSEKAGQIMKKGKVLDLDASGNPQLGPDGKFLMKDITEADNMTKIEYLQLKREDYALILQAQGKTDKQIEKAVKNKYGKGSELHKLEQYQFNASYDDLPKSKKELRKLIADALGVKKKDLKKVGVFS